MGDIRTADMTEAAATADPTAPEAGIPAAAEVPVADEAPAVDEGTNEFAPLLLERKPAARKGGRVYVWVAWRHFKTAERTHS